MLSISTITIWSIAFLFLQSSLFPFIVATQRTVANVELNGQNGNLPIGRHQQNVKGNNRPERKISLKKGTHTQKNKIVGRHQQEIVHISQCVTNKGSMNCFILCNQTNAFCTAKNHAKYIVYTFFYFVVLWILICASIRSLLCFHILYIFGYCSL